MHPAKIAKVNGINIRTKMKNGKWIWKGMLAATERS